MAEFVWFHIEQDGESDQITDFNSHLDGAFHLQSPPRWAIVAFHAFQNCPLVERVLSTRSLQKFDFLINNN